MSSGSGTNQNPNRRSRAAPREYDDDYPPLPSSSSHMLPPLRHLQLGGRPPFRRIPSAERRPHHRANLIARGTGHIPTDELDELSHSLEEANNNLRALLEIGGHAMSAMPPSTSPPPPPQQIPDHSQPQSQHEEGRRKRRKVDSDRVVPSFAGFSYGRYGQVEPGTLTMEIVDCDGGLFLNDANYAPENILKEDQSVYCTQGPRCNIILRHQGATVFNLTELVIRAPGASYSAPVREGMVFVTMNEDALLSRTAKYQIQYKTRNSDRADDRTAAAEAYWARNPRWRRYSQVARRGGRALLDITAMDTEDDLDHPQEQEAQMPREFTTMAVPPFRVTTECSEDEVEVRIDRPLRIGTLPFERDVALDSDSSDGGGAYMPNRDDDPWELELLTGGRDRGDRERSRTSRESSTLSEARALNQLATHEALRAVNGGGGALMAPHAKFHIEKGRTKCTIRFDPPVSGRFVLLKMWSPRGKESSNIDIQAVVAKGFAGPRYFPAVSML